MRLRDASDEVIKNAAYRMLRTGEMVGRGALRFMALENMYMHGSPIPPDKLIGDRLEPRVPTWIDAHGLIYCAGEAAICATRADPRLPSIRSLLHPDHPALAEINRTETLILSCRADRTGDELWFTSTDVIKSLDDAQARGYVYGWWRMASSPLPQYIDPPQRGVLGESRFTQPIESPYVAPIRRQDLPPELLIINGSRQDAVPFLAAVSTAKSIPHLARSMGIDVQPMGGQWPLRMHPGLAAS